MPYVVTTCDNDFVFVRLFFVFFFLSKILNRVNFLDCPFDLRNCLPNLKLSAPRLNPLQPSNNSNTIPNVHICLGTGSSSAIATSLTFTSALLPLLKILWYSLKSDKYSLPPTTRSRMFNSCHYVYIIQYNIFKLIIKWFGVTNDSRFSEWPYATGRLSTTLYVTGRFFTILSISNNSVCSSL